MGALGLTVKDKINIFEERFGQFEDVELCPAKKIIQRNKASGVISQEDLNKIFDSCATEVFGENYHEVIPTSGTTTRFDLCLRSKLGEDIPPQGTSPVIIASCIAGGAVVGFILGKMLK